MQRMQRKRRRPDMAAELKRMEEEAERKRIEQMNQQTEEWVALSKKYSKWGSVIIAGIGIVYFSRFAFQAIGATIKSFKTMVHDIQS